jgi:hypothetical protein
MLGPPPPQRKCGIELNNGEFGALIENNSLLLSLHRRL